MYRVKWVVPKTEQERSAPYYPLYLYYEPDAGTAKIENIPVGTWREYCTESDIKAAD